MKKLSFLLPFLTCVVLLFLARGTQAQFETPNRSFHNATSFRLEGRHLTVACESCHLNGQFSGTPKTCYDCHWVRRKDDRYQTRLGSQCETCHRSTSWVDVRWDHGAQTGERLNADHRTLACESCHRGANFRGSASGCLSCHEKDYAATTSPNHAAAGFPTSCETCHRASEATWRNAGGGGFNHNAVFQLLGNHATANCISCHKNSVYKGTARDCVGCHLDKYNATKAPNHVAAGFPAACESCHRASDTSWSGAGFNHGSVFALVGRHATAQCATCHVNNVYKGTSRDCVGCHRDNYTATRSPNHAAAGFSTSCETCHRASDPAWTGASFNHASVFALVGRHASAQCASCHVNNVYRGTARSCVGCHQAQYNATRNPSHGSVGFNTNCETCHRATDSSWTQGTFNHTRFPLSGRHNVACAQCHTSGNYSTFSCTVCHERSKMDSEHRGRSGYVYDSRACYSCHPNGRS